MAEVLEILNSEMRKTFVGSSRIDDVLNNAFDSGFESSANGLTLKDEIELRAVTENKLFGFGELQPLLDDPSIEEIWVNGPDRVFVARSGIAEQLNLSFTADAISLQVERMLRATGRRLDRSSPFVDASLPDGSRLHVVIPDITRKHWSINIRKFPRKILTLKDLVSFGSIEEGQAEYLAGEMNSGANVLVSGATQAGKTTFLCALLDSLDPRHRIVTVEETFEIRLRQPDSVAMQTRQPNLEGLGEVNLRKLIKEALRMRPSRLVVGEVREAEALDLLIALNSGLPGLCTIHANSARDALVKICTLPLLAGQNISSEFVVPTVASCLDLVIHCELNDDGRRKVKEIRRVIGFDGQIKTELVEL